MGFRIGKGGQPVDLEECLDGTTLELLRELVGLNALVSLGCSRDLGALHVTVTVGGEWDDLWTRSFDELHEWLKEAVAVVGATPKPDPNDSRARRRR